MPEEHRIRCPRGHWAFSATTEGIAFKCRANECRTVYVIPWAEIDKKRLEMAQGCAILPGKQESTR